jgi:hypothetical protein
MTTLKKITIKTMWGQEYEVCFCNAILAGDVKKCLTELAEHDNLNYPGELINLHNKQMGIYADAHVFRNDAVSYMVLEPMPCNLDHSKPVGLCVGGMCRFNYVL